MNIEIIPGILEGKIDAPPSKSITHRLLIIGALSGKECSIQNPLFCDDTKITLQALSILGFEFEIKNDSILFKGNRKQISKPVELFVGNSGTSARFLTALAALLPIESFIDGAPRMCQRPMAPLIQALQKLGAEIEHQSGNLPLRIKGGNLTGGGIEIDSTYTSQFLSAILLIAPYLRQDLQIYFSNFIASKPYVDTTIALMRKAGISITEDQNRYEIAARKRYSFDLMKVEGDYSNVAQLMVGAAISGGRIVFRNLCPESIQGDKIIIRILSEAGAMVVTNDNELNVQSDEINSIERDMLDNPDLIPPLSVLSLFAKSKSVLRNVGNLRLKESDRLQAIMQNIKRLGGIAYLDANDLVIEPIPLSSACLRSYNDHRIVMSFAMAGLKVPGITIENPECVRKSYPSFWEDFKGLIN